MYKKLLKFINFILTKTAILLILAYRYILSPVLPTSCRYSTSCSEYAILSFQKYGLIVGSWKTVQRIISCNPFSNHYVDEDFK